ncbi:MAG: hypothetical protein ABI321_05215 [Polyangia bacterium]
MPAPQFHLSFGLSIEGDPRVPTRMRDACRNEPTYVRLGSIIHDLPYYGNMMVEAIRYGLGSPAVDEPWAYRMHSVDPARFVASYIRAAKQAPGLTNDERLALVGGLVSHCALDLAFHPLVNYCARRDARELGGHESMHHRVTEKYHALFFHVERHGDDPVGTAEFRRWTQVTKQGGALWAKVEPALVDFIREAYRGAYGDAPQAHKWQNWVRSFRHFGLLVGSPLAAKNSQIVRHDASLKARYFQNDVFDFWAFYEGAERKLSTLTHLATDYFEAGDFSPEAEAAFVRDSRIDDLAEPIASDDLPVLPLLTAVCTPGITLPAGERPWRKLARKRQARRAMATPPASV